MGVCVCVCVCAHTIATNIYFLQWLRPTFIPSTPSQLCGCHIYKVVCVCVCVCVWCVSDVCVCVFMCM